jgi:serine/threonine protein kinase
MSRAGSSSNRPVSGPLEGVPQAGAIIAGKYKVEGVLGAGGMGVVLAARHMQLGQLVAIKFIRGAAAEDPAAVERFLREARAAVALSSEHVTKVLDVGTLDTGEPYMIMEFLDGVDLAEVLRREGPMPVARAVAAVLQASEALAEAHAIGIVHRDLKPANLFVATRRDGTPLVKVLDFGISKVTDLNVEGGPTLTASGLIMGSPGYMSPEQVRNAKVADARADIWALGVILYELVTGVSPFMGQTIGDTFARIISETPTPIHKLRSDVPEAFAAVISRCFERSVERRVQTVAELAEALAPFAPPEAVISVQRILRIAQSRGRESGRVETVAAPPGSRFDTDSRNALSPSGSHQTEPAWLRSGAGLAPSHKPSVSVLSAAIAIAAVGALAGTWVVFARGPRTPTPAATSASAPATAMAPPKVVPNDVAPVAPLPPVATRETSPSPALDAASGEAQSPPTAAPSPSPAAPANFRHAPAPSRGQPKPPGEAPLEELLERRQ